MNYERWIRNKRQSIAGIYDDAERARAAALVLPELDRQRRAVGRDRKSFESRLPESNAIVASTVGHGSWDWLLAAVGVFAVDVGVWFWTRRTSMPGLTVAESLALSLFAASVLAMMGHAITRITCTVRFNAEATIRRHRLLACSSGGLAAVSGLWVLISGYLSPELVERVLSWGWVPFVGLNLGGPACAGVCSSAAWYLLSPKRVQDKCTRAEEALTALAELRAWLQAQISSDSAGNVRSHRENVNHQGSRKPVHKHAGARSRPPRRARSRSNGAGIATVLIVGVLLFGSATVAGSVPPIVTTLAADASPERRGTCALFADATATVSDKARRLATEFLVSTLWSLIDEYGCDRIVAGTFTDGGPWTARTWFDPVPTAPASLDCATQFASKAVDCSTTEPEPLRGLLASYGGFGNVREFRKRRAASACEDARERQDRDQSSREQECRENQTRQRERYEAASISFAREIKTALTVDAPQTDARTGIAPLLESLLTADETRVVVLVTDAIDTGWRKTGALPVIKVPPMLDVVMVVTEPDPGYADRAEVLAAVEAWHRTVPSMVVVLTTELHDRFWIGRAR